MLKHTAFRPCTAQESVYGGAVSSSNQRGCGGRPGQCRSKHPIIELNQCYDVARSLEWPNTGIVGVVLILKSNKPESTRAVVLPSSNK